MIIVKKGFFIVFINGLNNHNIELLFLQCHLLLLNYNEYYCVSSCPHSQSTDSTKSIESRIPKLSDEYLRMSITDGNFS